MTLGLPQRIESKISPEPNSGCWLWDAYQMEGGYGQVYFNGGPRLAHRVVYQMLKGPLPVGKPHIDHLCRNHSCVNPDHLEPVTNKENLHRGEHFMAKQARQTHCKHGHIFDAHNTMTEKGKFGPKRKCRTCHYRYINLRLERKRKGKT